MSRTIMRRRIHCLRDSWSRHIRLGSLFSALPDGFYAEKYISALKPRSEISSLLLLPTASEPNPK